LWARSTKDNDNDEFAVWRGHGGVGALLLETPPCPRQTANSSLSLSFVDLAHKLHIDSLGGAEQSRPNAAPLPGLSLSLSLSLKVGLSCSVPATRRHRPSSHTAAICICRLKSASAQQIGRHRKHDVRSGSCQASTVVIWQKFFFCLFLVLVLIVIIVVFVNVMPSCCNYIWLNE